jgi:hypothetical protein
LRLGVHDLLDDGEQVERAAGEPVDARHRHHVARGESLQHPQKLAPVGARPSLVKSQSFPTGVIVTNYKPDGTVKTGDFQLAEPSEAELERRRNLT